MPLNLSQGAVIALDGPFQARVAMAFFYVARSVFTENPETPGHENRERFARGILVSDAESFLQYAAMVVTDPDIIAAGPANGAAVTDGQIINAVAAMWNTLANVPGA